MTYNSQLFFWRPCIRQCWEGRWSTAIFLRTSVKTILSAHGTKCFNYCFLNFKRQNFNCNNRKIHQKRHHYLMINSCPDKTQSWTYLQDYILKTSSEGNEPEWRERGIFSTFPIAAGLVWKLGALSGMIAHTVYGIIAKDSWISHYDS